MIDRKQYQKQYQKKWRAENREKRAASQRAYEKTEKGKATKKRYKKKHPNLDWRLIDAPDAPFGIREEDDLESGDFTVRDQF